MSAIVRVRLSDMGRARLGFRMRLRDMGRARLRGFVLESVSALGIRVAQGLEVYIWRGLGSALGYKAAFEVAAML